MISDRMIEISRMMRENNSRINMINYRIAIGETPNYEDKIKILKEAYDYAKALAIECYIENYGMYGFQDISQHILECESSIPRKFLLENNPKIILSRQNLKDIKEEEELLNAIVGLARKHLIEEINSNLYRKKTLAECDLANYCLRISKYIEEICQKNNIPCYCKLIEPGYINYSTLYNHYGCHAFDIVRLNDKNYLIDCTYSQFFITSKTLIDRLGIPMVTSPYAGLYMTMSENRKKVAEKIINDGWILLTDEVLKDYLDGFTIFYRNGLYYEKTNDFSFSTSYTPTDYINFLKGNDSKNKHEKMSWLGYQKRPLNDPKITFNKR